MISSSSSSDLGSNKQNIIPNMLYVSSNLLTEGYDQNYIYQELKSIFQEQGEVQFVRIYFNQAKHFFFAFIKMREHQLALKCIKEINKKKFGKFQLKVSHYTVAKCNSKSVEKFSTKYPSGCFACGDNNHQVAQCHFKQRKRSSIIYKKLYINDSFSSLSSSEDDASKRYSIKKHRRNFIRSFSREHKKDKSSFKKAFNAIKRNSYQENTEQQLSSFSSQY